MRIGILTSGGDTPGMNAVIRGAFIMCQRQGYELLGISKGWKGLLDNLTTTIDSNIIDNIDLGGTILGSSRTNPVNQENYLVKINDTINSNKLSGIIAIGGEDTLGAAKALFDLGIPIVGVPKTIDNDLDATDYTFGFNTAMTIVTEAIDRLKTTAKSHERVMVVEIMGRHAGWMTLHGGIAGGAHVILIPEFEVSKQVICNIIKKRYDNGNKWGIIAISEGYGFSESNTENMKKDEFGHVLLEKMSTGEKIAKMVENELGITTRATVLGHVQRGGSPSPFDRVLSTQLGISAVKLLQEKKFGYMPALRGTKIMEVQLADAVSKLKVVDSDSWEYAKILMNI